VANIATPMDGELALLNQELNDTYLAYGKNGEKFRDNQIAQDKNAYAMSPSAAASRAVTKVSGLYDSSQWDLLDAIESGAELEDMDPEDLPAEMRSMDEEERKEHVRQYAKKRDALRSRVNDLDKDRRLYIANERSKQAETGAKGLDEAMQEGLRSIAEEKGFTFEEN
jgi:hypothetical protein